MSTINTTFLDKIDNEGVDKNKVIDLFQNLKKEDLEYSNTGYFQFNISNGSSVILHFSAIDNENISFRYDENIPDARNGESWYSSNDSSDSKIVDAGDENYVPKNSFLNVSKTIKVIDEFFDNPLVKPNAVGWTNAEDFN